MQQVVAHIHREDHKDFKKKWKRPLYIIYYLAIACFMGLPVLATATKYCICGIASITYLMQVCLCGLQH